MIIGNSFEDRKEIKELAIATCVDISNRLDSVSIKKLTKTFETIIPIQMTFEELVDKHGRSLISSAKPVWAYKLEDAFAGHHQNLVIEYHSDYNPTEFGFAITALYLAQFSKKNAASRLKTDKDKFEIFEQYSNDPVNYFLRICISYFDVTYV